MIKVFPFQSVSIGIERSWFYIIFFPFHVHYFASILPVIYLFGSNSKEFHKWRVLFWFKCKYSSAYQDDKKKNENNIHNQIRLMFVTQWLRLLFTPFEHTFLFYMFLHVRQRFKHDFQKQFSNRFIVDGFYLKLFINVNENVTLFGTQIELFRYPCYSKRFSILY